MRQLLFEKIDVFTHGRSDGNPAGLVRIPWSAPMSDTDMQQLGKELRGYVNETAFVHEKDGEFFLRFFSSESEVAFCGHALVGTFYRLIRSTPELMDKSTLSINVRAGKLLVYNRIKEEDAVYIAAPQPKFLERDITSEEIRTALGLAAYQPDDLLPEVIDGGLCTLICPMPSLDFVLDMLPNESELRRFCLDKNIDIVHVFTDDTIDAGADYRTRVFAPKFGYLEDPATGSGNAAFAWYLHKHGLLPERLIIEQGPSRDIPNRVAIKRIDQKEETTVLFGGRAETRLQGTYYLR